MKLQDRLPYSVRVGRRTYNVNLDFRNVLRMLDVMARTDLLPEARDYLALKCVMWHPHGDIRAIMSALRELLFPAADATRRHRQKLTDFVQDADLIRAAFYQSYGINLWRDDLHWMEFTSLLAGLPEGSRYSEILGIRARPMPKPTKYNAEERKWLARAKAEHAVRLTDREREDGLREGLRGVAMSLLALADHGNGGESDG